MLSSLSNWENDAHDDLLKAVKRWLENILLRYYDTQARTGNTEADCTKVTETQETYVCRTVAF